MDLHPDHDCVAAGCDPGVHIDPAERVAHAMLNIAADLPGRCGRLRMARLAGGFHVATMGPDQSRFAVPGLDWTLRDLGLMVDALVQGGLLASTSRVLMLTRAGWRALDALENPEEAVTR